jgi:hypothetical protein
MLAGFLLLGQVPPARLELSVLRARRTWPRSGATALRSPRSSSSPGRVHQVGAVPVPLLAAERDGGAHAGERLPALGDDGEGGGLPARPHAPGLRRDRRCGCSSSAGRRVTMLSAASALRQTDLKRLAYSTVAALGIMTLLGARHRVRGKAAVVFLLGHALYKGALFLVAGIVDHETGTRDVRRRRPAPAMPLTAAAAVLAALSMAGRPPSSGSSARSWATRPTRAGPSSCSASSPGQP